MQTSDSGIRCSNGQTRLNSLSTTGSSPRKRDIKALIKTNLVLSKNLRFHDYESTEKINSDRISKTAIVT